MSLLYYTTSCNREIDNERRIKAKISIDSWNDIRSKTLQQLSKDKSPAVLNIYMGMTLDRLCSMMCQDVNSPSFTADGQYIQTIFY